MQGLLGYVALLAFALAISEKRSRVPWRTVCGGLLLQWALALLLLRVPVAQRAVLLLNDGGGRAAARRRMPAPGSCSATWAAGRCPSRRSGPVPA